MERSWMERSWLDEERLTIERLATVLDRQETARTTGRSPATEVALGSLSSALALEEATACLELIRAGDWEEAARYLLAYNPLPAITGRLAPYGEQTGGSDRSAFIAAIERYLGDRILAQADRFLSASAEVTGKSIVVIGSGPAGLTAAFYLRRAGHHVTVLDRLPEAGGMLMYSIPDFRLPKEIVRRQVGALEKIGITFELGVELGKDVSIEKLMTSHGAVFLAIGVWKERTLGIEGEEHVASGLGFLNAARFGAAQVPAGRVAVIGGGSVALDIARTLRRLGAEPIVLYRRTEGEMPAGRDEIEKAKEESVGFQFLTLPVRASPQGQQVLLECVHVEPETTEAPASAPAKAGRRFTSAYDMVIKAVGGVRDVSFLPPSFVDESGQLKAEADGYHLGRNLFVGGDFLSGPSTVAAAIQAGREAASQIDRYLGARG